MAAALMAAALALAVVAGACSGGNDREPGSAAITGDDVADPGRDTLVVAINADPANLSPVFLDINTGNW